VTVTRLKNVQTGSSGVDHRWGVLSFYIRNQPRVNLSSNNPKHPNNMKIPVIDYLLESEDYVPFDPQKHDKLHFNMCRLVKDEIRSHKWIEAERGRQLTWEDAVTEWMDQHYDQFIDAIVPQKRILEFLKKRSKECFTALGEYEEARSKYGALPSL